MKAHDMKQTLRIAAFAATLAAAPWGTALGQTGTITPEKDAHAAHHPDAKPADSTFAEGEVRKVDKDAGKITLRHGPIPSLDMPAMSMVFRVKDAQMLDQVKAGDKIRFKADKILGAYTVTEIAAAN